MRDQSQHTRETERLVLTSRSLAAKVVKDVTQLVLARRTRMCNFLEYKGEPPLLSSFNTPPS